MIHRIGVFFFNLMIICFFFLLFKFNPYSFDCDFFLIILLIKLSFQLHPSILYFSSCYILSLFLLFLFLLFSILFYLNFFFYFIPQYFIDPDSFNLASHLCRKVGPDWLRYFFSFFFTINFCIVSFYRVILISCIQSYIGFAC